MTNTKNQKDLLAKLAQLEQENERLRIEAANPIRLARSRYGALQLYGIRRIPIAFYRDEWDTILGQADRIRERLEELSSDTVGVDEAILDKATSYELWPSDGNGQREKPTKKVAQ